MGMEYGNKIPSEQGLNPEIKDYADSAQIRNLTHEKNAIEKINNLTYFDELSFFRESENSFQVIAKNSLRHTTYRFEKDANDDYVRLEDGYVGELTEEDVLLSDSVWGSRTGTWVDTFPPNIYTSEIGATMTLDFVGTRLDFKHSSDNRGGVWEFVIDGNTTVDVSTWSNSGTITTSITTVVSELDYTKHTVVATFTGDDPINPPTGGISRGWVIYDELDEDRRPFYMYYESENYNTNDAVLLYGNSNKEYAFQIRPDGSSDDYNFIPEHSGIGTAFQTHSPIVKIDGVVTDISEVYYIESFKRFSIEQSIDGVDPTSGTHMINVETTHTLDVSGNFLINGKMRALKPTDINIGYYCMLPINYGTLDKLVTGIGVSYDLTISDASNEALLAEKDRVANYMALSTTNPDYICGMTIEDMENSLRQNSSDRKEGDVNCPLYLNHRDAILQKLYPTVFQATTLASGSEFAWSAYLFAKKIYNVNEIIT